MPIAVQHATCKLDSLGERTLAALFEKCRSVTARSIDRLIKVARTIADLLSQDDIDAGCLLEAAAPPRRRPHRRPRAPRHVTPNHSIAIRVTRSKVPGRWVAPARPQFGPI
jgi:hypothetical protein